MDSIFCNLPAPKRPHYDATGAVTTTAAPTFDMSVFNDADNPCFHGSCTVKLFDGSIKFVKDIRRGDRLYPHGGTINYVLKTICKNREAQMVLVCVYLFLSSFNLIKHILL